MKYYIELVDNLSVSDVAFSCRPCERALNIEMQGSIYIE